MKLGRRSRRFLYALGALAFLFGILHTRPAKHTTRKLLVRTLTSLFGGSASVGSLDYRLWLGEARVERLVFEPDPNELPVIVEADRLVLRLSASLESPSVTYIDDDPGSSEDDTDIALFLGLVGDVRATKGTFHWLHPREWLSVSGIELEALLANGAHRIAAHGGEGRIFVGNREIYFGPSDLDATLDAEGLHLASGTVFVDDSFVRAEGTLRFDKATTTDLDLSFALDGALARLIDEELSLEGVLSGEAQAHIEHGSPVVEAELRSERIQITGVTVTEIEARAHITEDVLALQPLTARAFRGTARLDAQNPFGTTEPSNFDLQMQGIDATAAAEALTDTKLPVASRVGGELHLAIPDWDLCRATGEAELRLSGDAVGTIALALDSGVVAVNAPDTALPALGTELALNGRVTLDGGTELDYDAQVSNLGTLASRFVSDLPLTVSGPIGARGHVGGSFREPRWSSSITSEELRIESLPFLFASTLTGSLDSIELETLSLVQPGGGGVTAAGSIPLGDEGVWALDVDIRSLDFPTIAAIRTGEAGISGRARVTGPAKEPELSAELEVFGLRFPEPMQGIVAIDIDLAGPIQELAGRAELRASEILLHGTTLPSFAIAAVSDTDAVRLTGRRADGTPMLSGILPLSEPYVLRCEVPLSALPLSEFAESLQHSGMKTAEWSAEGTLAFEVPLREPETLRYRASFTSLLGDYELARAEASPFVVEGGLASLEVQGLEIRGVRNRASIDGSIPLDPEESYDLAIE